jgi:hypothetical protein
MTSVSLHRMLERATAKRAAFTTPIVRIAHQCTPKHCLYTPCTVTLSNCRTTSYKDRRAADNVLVVR